MPEVTDQQCQQVTAALAKSPGAQKKLDDLRERMRSGELDRQALQAESQKIYAEAKVDPDVARACRFRQGGGGQQAGAQGVGEHLQCRGVQVERGLRGRIGGGHACTVHVHTIYAQ